jgi:hypothetical protein
MIQMASDSRTTGQINGTSFTTPSRITPPITPDTPHALLKHPNSPIPDTPMSSTPKFSMIEQNRMSYYWMATLKHFALLSLLEPGSRSKQLSAQTAYSEISIVEINRSCQVASVLSPSNTASPPAEPAQALWFNHAIISLCVSTAPTQKGADCFSCAGLVGFPKTGARADWLPYVTALGLAPGEYPKIHVTGKREQTGRVRGQNVVDWNFLLYIVLAVAPGGKMKLNTIFNICLAWCDKLAPINATCRHNLTTKVEFINFVDSSEVYDKNDTWWRLANEGEIQIKKNTEKEVVATGPDKVQVTKRSLKKEVPTKKSPAKSDQEGKKTGWTPINGQNIDSSQPTPSKYTTAAQRRKREVSQFLSSAEDEEKHSPGSQIRASRKRRRSAPQPRNEGGKGGSQNPGKECNRSQGSKTQANQQVNNVSQTQDDDGDDDDEQTDSGSLANTGTVSDRLVFPNGWKEPVPQADTFATARRHDGSYKHITASERMVQFLNDTTWKKAFRDEVSSSYYTESSWTSKPERDATMRHLGTPRFYLDDALACNDSYVRGT